MEFSNLQKEDQLNRIEEWNKYYSKTKDSVIYEMFKTQHDAMLKNNWKLVSEIAQQVKEMIKNGDHLTTTMPASIDPWEYRHNQDIRAYVEACEKIEEMAEGTVDEIFSL